MTSIDIPCPDVSELAASQIASDTRQVNDHMTRFWLGAF